jgi:Stress responsive A/B Barrel Domain
VKCWSIWSLSMWFLIFWIRTKSKMMVRSGDTLQRMNSSSSVYRHIVLFAFKANATPAQVQTVIDAFAALRSQISSILEFEHGINESPENLNDGFTHVFTMTFSSREAFEHSYLHEPAHQAFVKGLDGLLEKALVVDFVPARA